MSAKKGRAWLIEVDDGSGGWVPFLGLSSRSLSLNGERVDTTVPDALDPEGPLWASSVDGVRSVGFQGDARLQEGDASLQRLQSMLHSDDMTGTFRVRIPGWGDYSGLFSLNAEFGSDGVVTMSLSGQSSGTVTFTAA